MLIDNMITQFLFDNLKNIKRIFILLFTAQTTDQNLNKAKQDGRNGIEYTV